jgi:hypothetical protein
VLRAWAARARSGSLSANVPLSLLLPLARSARLRALVRYGQWDGDHSWQRSCKSAAWTKLLADRSLPGLPADLLVGESVRLIARIGCLRPRGVVVCERLLTKTLSRWRRLFLMLGERPA